MYKLSFFSYMYVFNYVQIAGITFFFFESQIIWLQCVSQPFAPGNGSCWYVHVCDVRWSIITEGIHSKPIYTGTLHSKGIHSKPIYTLHSEGIHLKPIHCIQKAFIQNLYIVFRRHSFKTIHCILGILTWTLQILFMSHSLLIHIIWWHWSIECLFLERQSYDTPMRFLCYLVRFHS